MRTIISPAIGCLDSRGEYPETQRMLLVGAATDLGVAGPSVTMVVTFLPMANGKAPEVITHLFFTPETAEMLIENLQVAIKVARKK